MSGVSMIYIGNDSEVVIRDITVTENKGALINLEDSSVNISSAILRENSAYRPFISITGSPVEFDNLLFERNFEQSLPSAVVINKDVQGVPSMGMIHALDSIIEFHHCLFFNNSVEHSAEKHPVAIVGLQETKALFRNSAADNTGGSIWSGFLKLLESSTRLINCNFTNSVSNEAGAIDISQNSILLMGNVLFENNSCGLDGGAIKASRNSSIIMLNSTFVENKSFSSSGGAIFMEDSCIMESKNCLFTHNTAALEGGAILTVDHCSHADYGSLFLNNTAAHYGK